MVGPYWPVITYNEARREREKRSYEKGEEEER
jgi:hypothetical protein